MIHQEERRESSCVSFLESMKEKMELMMKVGDISDNFSRHSLTSKRRKCNMDPQILAEYEEIRKDCEEGGMRLSEACRKREHKSSRVYHYAYDNGWDLEEFRTKRLMDIDAECRRLHDKITFNTCTARSVLGDFNVTERQYLSWKARQRSINAGRK